jgi:hypothetical protein
MKQVNRFNGFPVSRQTVKTVSNLAAAFLTGLKPGENERTTLLTKEQDNFEEFYD